MTYANTITGKVVGTVRHGHTVYGNPMMSVVIELHAIEGTPVVPCEHVGCRATVRISDNSGIVYGIENREYRELVHTYTLTKAGRIKNVERADNV